MPTKKPSQSRTSQEKKPAKPRSKPSANAKPRIGLKKKANPKVKPKSGRAPKLDANGHYIFHGSFNPLYDPGMCEDAVKYYKRGFNDIQVSVAINVGKRSFERWIKEKPEFKEAVMQGREMAEAHWHGIGQGGAEGFLKTNAAIWYGVMRNRYGWVDTLAVDVNANTKEIKELKEAIDRVKKHEKEA